MSNQKDDVEALLFPERPELRWAFIRKVYSILTLQLLAAIVVTVHPIANFFSTTKLGLAVYILILIVVIIVICVIYIYQDKHPLNFVLLGIFTLWFGLAIGKIIIEAGIATAVVVVHVLGSKKRPRFRFPFTIFQILFPMRKISQMIYSVVSVIIFCAYIIYDTGKLIKRHSDNQYIWASVSLYVDALKLILYWLRVLRARFCQ